MGRELLIISNQYQATASPADAVKLTFRLASSCMAAPGAKLQYDSGGKQSALTSTRGTSAASCRSPAVVGMDLHAPALQCGRAGSAERMARRSMSVSRSSLRPWVHSTAGLR